MRAKGLEPLHRRHWFLRPACLPIPPRSRFIMFFQILILTLLNTESVALLAEPTALKKLLPKVDALWLIPDPIVISNIESVNKLFGQCQTAGKPIYTYDKAFAGLGATLIMSADIPTMIRQSAEIIFSIQEDRKIEEKVQNPAGSHIILNMKKVEEYGLNLNIEALDSVNEIVR